MQEIAKSFEEFGRIVVGEKSGRTNRRVPCAGGVPAPTTSSTLLPLWRPNRVAARHLKQFEFIVPLLVQASQQGMLRDLTVPVGDAK